MNEPIESYRAALADLTFNSKPLINMLTMLAEESEQMATEIVQVIDEQIDKAPTNQKLPLLYLIDSMIKNLESTLYPQLFIQRISSIFTRVFEEVDEKTRTSMYKLRQTWSKVIPNNKLFALDVRVKRIDPAWPVTAKAPEQGSIHVNPKFLAREQQQLSQTSTSSGENSPVWSSSPQMDLPPAPVADVKLQDELQEKEHELKKLKLELELAKTRAKLEQEKTALEKKHQKELAHLKALESRVSKEKEAKDARPRDPRLARDPRLSQLKGPDAGDKDMGGYTPPDISRASRLTQDPRLAGRDPAQDPRLAVRDPQVQDPRIAGRDLSAQDPRLANRDPPAQDPRLANRDPRRRNQPSAVLPTPMSQPQAQTAPSPASLPMPPDHFAPEKEYVPPSRLPKPQPSRPLPSQPPRPAQSQPARSAQAPRPTQASQPGPGSAEEASNNQAPAAPVNLNDLTDWFNAKLVKGQPMTRGAYAPPSAAPVPPVQEKAPALAAMPAQLPPVQNVVQPTPAPVAYAPVPVPIPPPISAPIPAPVPPPISAPVPPPTAPVIPDAAPVTPSLPPLEAIPLPDMSSAIPLPTKPPPAKAKAAPSKAGKAAKKPIKKKEIKPEEAAEEKTPAPVKFKINTVEITEPPPISEKIQEAAKRKVPLKVEKKEEGSTAPAASKRSKKDSGEKEEEERPKERASGKDRSSHSSSHDRKSGSRSRRSSSPDRRDSKDDRSRSSKERRFSRERDHHSGGWDRRDDRRRSPPHFSHRGRGFRGRGRHYRRYSPVKSRSTTRSRSHSPPKQDGDKPRVEESVPMKTEEKEATTLSASNSDTGAAAPSSVKDESSGTTLADEKDLQDVDERPLKRPTPSAADVPDEAAPQPKKARVSPSEDSTDTSAPETSAAETDSKEDLGHMFSGEDVDYRQQALSQASASREVQQSPGQQRWSKFKENNPKDFAIELERRKSQSAMDEVRRASLAAAGVSGPRHENFDRSLQDVDFRRRDPEQGGLPPTPGAEEDSKGEGIPKALMLENQGEIIMQAEQEVKAGRMSHDEHQSLLRQLGQVYQLQRRQRGHPDDPPILRPPHPDPLFPHPSGGFPDQDHRQAEDDRDLRRRDQEGDMDFRWRARREGGPFTSPRNDFESQGSPKAHGSPRTDFDARRGLDEERGHHRPGGPRRNAGREEKDFDSADGPQPLEGPSSKRPLLGLAPGVPLEGPGPNRNPPRDFDDHDHRWRDRPRPDQPGGPESRDFDHRGPPDRRGPPRDQRGPLRDFRGLPRELGGPPDDFDHRGPGRDHRGPPRDFDPRHGPRDFGNRGPPGEEFEHGPFEEEFDPRDFHGPRRGRGRGRDRGRGGRGQRRLRDDEPPDLFGPNDPDRRHPRDFEGRGPRGNFDERGPPRDFDNRGPPRDFDDRPPREFDNRGPPRGPDDRGPRGFDDRRLPRGFADRGPPRGFDERGPPRGPDERGPRDFDDRGPPRGPDERGPPRGPDERGPRGFDDRALPRGFDDRGPPRGPDDRRPPRGFDDRGPPRGPDDRVPPAGFDDRGPPRGTDDRVPPAGFDVRGPPRGPDDRVPPAAFDDRGPPRGPDDRVPLAGFDDRGPPRGPDDRGPPKDFDDRGPPREDDKPRSPRDSDKPPMPPAPGMQAPPRPIMGPPEGRNFNGTLRPRMDALAPRPLMEVPLRPHGPRGFAARGLRPPGIPEEAPPKILPGSPMDDPRWSAMRGLLEKEVPEEVVIDGKPYEVKQGVRRLIKLNGRECEVYVDPQERGVRLNGNIVYKFGEPKKDIDLGYCVVEMFYHGPPLNIWIDGQQHRVRLDAPPLSMTFDNNVFGFQIDGRDRMVLVDRLEKGVLGGPPRPLYLNNVQHEIAFEAPKRHILIDQQSCELKLDRKIPHIIYNGKPHGIRFEGGPRKMFIDGVAFVVPLDVAIKAKIGNRPHLLAFGGPAHEVIVDGKWFEVKFNNVPKNITIGNRMHSIRLEPPVPRVKILAEITRGLEEGDPLLGQTNKPIPLPRPPLPPPAMMGPNKAQAKPGEGPVTANQSVKLERGPLPQGSPGVQPDAAAMQQNPQPVALPQPISQPAAATATQPSMVAAQPNMQPSQPNLAMTQPNMSASQPSLAMGQPNMPVSQPNMSMAQPNMPVSQPNMSIAQPNMSIAQPNMPVSQPNMSMPSANPALQQGQGPLGQGPQRMAGPMLRPMMMNQGAGVLGPAPGVMGPAPGVMGQAPPAMMLASLVQGGPGPSPGMSPGMGNMGPGMMYPNPAMGQPFQQRQMLMQNMNPGMGPQQMGPGMSQQQMGADMRMQQMGPGMGPDMRQQQMGPGMGPDMRQQQMGPGMGPDMRQQQMGPGMGPDMRQQQMGQDMRQQQLGSVGMVPDMRQHQMGPGMVPDMRQQQMGPDMRQQQMGPDMRPQQMGAAGMTPQPGFPGMTPQQVMGAAGIQVPPVTTAVPASEQSTDTATTASAATPTPTPSVAPTDVNDLLKKLLAAGIIGKKPAEEKAPESGPASADEAAEELEHAEEEEEEEEQKPAPSSKKLKKKDPPLERPPDLSDFQTTKMRKQYSWVVHNLYQGMQCTSCGCRFLMEEMEQYRQHLDWHFRLNKRDKEAAKITSFRKWYYDLNDWIMYQEIDESEEALHSTVFDEEAAQQSQNNQTLYPVKVPEGAQVTYNPTATGQEAEDLCVTCGDPFEQFWDEEAEEWHLRNAIRIDAKIYHPICYEDAREGSGSDVTPTPVTDPAENPLVTQIKQESSAEVTPASPGATPTASAHALDIAGSASTHDALSPATPVKRTDVTPVKRTDVTPVKSESASEAIPHSSPLVADIAGPAQLVSEAVAVKVEPVSEDGLLGGKIEETLPVQVPSDIPVKIEPGLKTEVSEPAAAPIEESVPSISAPTEESVPSISAPVAESVPSISAPTAESIPSIPAPVADSVPSIPAPVANSVPAPITDSTLSAKEESDVLPPASSAAGDPAPASLVKSEVLEGEASLSGSAVDNPGVEVVSTPTAGNLLPTPAGDGEIKSEVEVKMETEETEATS